MATSFRNFRSEESGTPCFSEHVKSLLTFTAYQGRIDKIICESDG